MDESLSWDAWPDRYIVVSLAQDPGGALVSSLGRDPSFDGATESLRLSSDDSAIFDEIAAGWARLRIAAAIAAGIASSFFTCGPCRLGGSVATADTLECDPLGFVITPYGNADLAPPSGERK